MLSPRNIQRGISVITTFMIGQLKPQPRESRPSRMSPARGMVEEDMGRECRMAMRPLQSHGCRPSPCCPCSPWPPSFRWPPPDCCLSPGMERRNSLRTSPSRWGSLPLILAVMSYFIPVLTRSAQRASASGGRPCWRGGRCARRACLRRRFFARPCSAWPRPGRCRGRRPGGWALYRARRMFGPRHRGLDWYLAALGFLLLALVAVVLMPVYPGQRNALRLFHLHANLLGFVGLTALGTLQVLLPTCMGRPDPGCGLAPEARPEMGGGGRAADLARRSRRAPGVAQRSPCLARHSALGSY
jgi:hypothetical protein